MNRKPDPAVFLRAAELIERGREKYACTAIFFALIKMEDDCSDLRDTPEYLLFAKHYQPQRCNGNIWFHGPFTQWRRARALRRCAKIAAQLNSQS